MLSLPEAVKKYEIAVPVSDNGINTTWAGFVSWLSEEHAESTKLVSDICGNGRYGITSWWSDRAEMEAFTPLSSAR